MANIKILLVGDSGKQRGREKWGRAHRLPFATSQQQNQRQHQHLAAKRVQLLRPSLRRHIIIERQINAAYGLMLLRIRSGLKENVVFSRQLACTGKAINLRSGRLPMHFTANVKAATRGAVYFLVL